MRSTHLFNSFSPMAIYADCFRRSSPPRSAVARLRCWQSLRQTELHRSAVRAGSPLPQERIRVPLPIKTSEISNVRYDTRVVGVVRVLLAEAVAACQFSRLFRTLPKTWVSGAHDADPSQLRSWKWPVQGIFQCFAVSCVSIEWWYTDVAW